MTFSGLTGLPVCIAPVPFGFPCRFVLQDAFDTVLVGQLTRFGFSSGRCGNGGISRCGFSGNAISLFKLYLLALGAALLTSFCNRPPFRLTGFPGRVGSILGGAKCQNKRCLGVLCGTAAV